MIQKLEKITLFSKQNSISLKLVRDISVHEDNVPSVKYIRNSHLWLFAFFAWLLFFQDFPWFQIKYLDHHFLFHWYAQEDQSLQEFHVVSLGRTLVHLQCRQFLHPNSKLCCKVKGKKLNLNRGARYGLEIPVIYTINRYKNAIE